MILLSGTNAFAATKTSISSGNWSNPSLWSPSGIPASNDDVFISSGNTVTLDADINVVNLQVNSGGTLNLAPNIRLTIDGNFTVNGIADMKGGNITFSTVGRQFNLGIGASFIWDPQINTSAEATLFTRATENFDPTSTLTIKKWYNYSIGLGSVVNGNFGNLVLNSPGGTSSIVEWNQNNEFHTHKILGTLTIDQGWITLDQSGSISTTAIGALELKNANSYFYGHNGSHPGTFTISIGTVINNGGTFYGLNDGQGNVTVNVSGNFTNIGNVKINNNSGVANVTNGNAIFNVNGTYTQSTGDTRFIYNVSTLNSGVYTASIKDLQLTGGIFMGQTGCHTGGNSCVLTVSENLNINFSKTTDKFRGISLSSIGSTINTSKFELRVGGNFSYSGPNNCEFTSSAGSGSENIQVGGNFTVSGGIASFNYGTVAASHDITTLISGNFSQNGGYTYFSRNNGNSTITLNGNLSISSGWGIVKGNTGNTNLTINGNYNQSGGNFYLHNNPTTFTSNPVQMNVYGSFTHSGGNYYFDDNTSSSSAVHTLVLRGSVMNLSGSGTITKAGSGTSAVLGRIIFNTNGILNYSRTSSHLLQQVKQEIASGCTLTVNSGSIQVASHQTAATDYFRILAGAKLSLNLGSLVSNSLFTNSGIQIDSAGILETQHANGLYDGSANAAISASGNMNYFIHASGITEYAGLSSQNVSGASFRILPTAQHDYGILRIRMPASSSIRAQLPGRNITVRNQLQLVQGELRLNGNQLILENGRPEAIIRTSGYLYSENDLSTLIWKNISTGTHEVPFGLDPGLYVPVWFSLQSGIGNDFSISTRATSGSDNKPFPGVLNAVSLMTNGTDISQREVIDRWWILDGPGMTANVTLTYAGRENTTAAEMATGNFSMLSWNGNRWNAPVGNGSGVTSGTGTVSVSNTGNFGVWTLAVQSTALPVSLSSFDAKADENSTHITWTTESEINNDYFTIERSNDGENFEFLHQVAGAGNSTRKLKYKYTDTEPLSGISYYRLKQTDFDGTFTYSEVRAVNFGKLHSNSVKIDEAGPNPFQSQFKVFYTIPEDGDVQFLLLNQNGQLVLEQKIPASKGSNTFYYNEGENLASGTYILKLVYRDSTDQRKFIKR